METKTAVVVYVILTVGGLLLGYWIGLTFTLF